MMFASKRCNDWLEESQDRRPDPRFSRRELYKISCARSVTIVHPTRMKNIRSRMNGSINQ